MLTMDPETMNKGSYVFLLEAISFFSGAQESPLLHPGNDLRWYRTTGGSWLKPGQFSKNVSPTPARNSETGRWAKSRGHYWMTPAVSLTGSRPSFCGECWSERSAGALLDRKALREWRNHILWAPKDPSDLVPCPCLEGGWKQLIWVHLCHRQESKENSSPISILPDAFRTV